MILQHMPTLAAIDWLILLNVAIVVLNALASFLGAKRGTNQNK